MNKCIIFTSELRDKPLITPKKTNKMTDSIILAKEHGENKGINNRTIWSVIEIKDCEISNLDYFIYKAEAIKYCKKNNLTISKSIDTTKDETIFSN